MSESTDNNVKNITNGLLAKAGALASLKQAAKEGTRHKEFNIAPDLATAMEKYASLKDAGTSVDDYIQQGNLFGAETTPFQTRVMQVFDQHRRSPKAIRSIVGNFLDLAEEAGDPNQRNFFGEKDTIDIKSAFEAAVKKYEDTIRTNEPAQDGLFGADSNQGLRLRPETDGDVSQDARPEGAETEESRQNRVENSPAYSKLETPASRAKKKKQLEEMPPVKADTSAFSSETDVRKLREIGKEEYKKLVEGQPIVNKFDGKEIKFTVRQFNKVRSHSADPRVMKIIPSLPELLENAVPLYSEKELHPEKYRNIENWNTYAAKVDLDGEINFVQLTTFDIKDEGTFISIHHDHNVTPEKIMKGSMSEPNSVTNKAVFTPNLSSNKLYQWWHSVNDFPPKLQGEQSESLAKDLSKNAEAFSKLKYGDEKSSFNAERINGAEITRAGNVLFANPDAMELIRQAHGIAFRQANQEIFVGTYQNPAYTEAVRDALKNGVLGGGSDYATKQRAAELLKTFDEAAKNPYRDTQIIATNKDAERGLKAARQEETAHQADYRIGLMHSIGKRVVSRSLVGRKAVRNLQKGAYEGVSNDVAAMEVIAKLFVEDEMETGLTVKQKEYLLVAYHAELAKNGKTSEDMESFAEISAIGREFYEQVKKYEKEREFQRSRGSNGTPGTERAATNDSSTQSDGETRRTRFAESYPNISSQPGNIGAGFLDTIGSGNQSLEKASPKNLERAAEFFEAVDLAPLYAKVPPSQKNSIATMLAPIWKGRNENSTPIKEVITNFRRAGLLTAPKTHLKNMGSNTLMQASEEASRPIAILADIAASAVTGQRTVQTISLSGLMKSFGALVRQDATLKALDKESGMARAWNILKNGDISELDKNQLKEMQSGSPIVDAMVNYTFRTLGAEDALFKTYAMRRSLEESAKTLAITERRTDKSITVSKRRDELLKNPTNEMLLEAELYADFTTFTNANPVSETLTKIKDTNSYAKFAIETIVPYDKTPTNIIARTLEYTPLGLGWAGKHLYDLKRGESYTFRKMREARDREQNEIVAQEKEIRAKANQKFAENMETLDNLIKNAETQAERDNLTAEKERHRKNFQTLKGRRKLEDEFRAVDHQEIQDTMDKLFPRIAQQQFARSVGRAGLGTAALGLGIYLAMEGLLSGVWDAGEREEMKEFYDRKDLGILNASLQIGNRRYGIGDTPLGKVMALGASIYERSQKTLKKNETENTKPLNDISDVARITVMEQPLLNSLDDYFGKGKTAEQRIGGLLGSFVPSILANVADVRDDAARDNKSWYSGINRIPGARNYNDVAKHPREPYLRDETNRLIDKFDPFNSRPATKPIPGGQVELLPEQKQKRLETLRRALSVTQSAKLKEKYEKEITELEGIKSNFADIPKKRGFVFEDIDEKFQLPVDTGWGYGSKTDEIINRPRQKATNLFGKYRQSENVEDARRGFVSMSADPRTQTAAQLDVRIETLTPKAVDFNEMAMLMKKAGDAKDVTEIFDNAEYEQGRLFPLLQRKLAQATRPKDKQRLQNSIDKFLANKENSKGLSDAIYDSDEVIELQRIRDEKQKNKQ